MYKNSLASYHDLHVSFEGKKYIYSVTVFKCWFFPIFFYHKNKFTHGLTLDAVLRISRSICSWEKKKCTFFLFLLHSIGWGWLNRVDCTWGGCENWINWKKKKKKQNKWPCFEIKPYNANVCKIQFHFGFHAESAQQYWLSIWFAYVHHSLKFTQNVPSYLYAICKRTNRLVGQENNNFYSVLHCCKLQQKPNNDFVLLLLVNLLGIRKKTESLSTSNLLRHEVCVAFSSCAFLQQIRIRNWTMHIRIQFSMWTKNVP